MSHIANVMSSRSNHLWRRSSNFDISIKALLAMCEFGIGALIETLRHLVRGIIDPLEPSDQSHQLTVDSKMDSQVHERDNENRKMICVEISWEATTSKFARNSGVS